jgi:hypothetical protein
MKKNRMLILLGATALLAAACFPQEDSCNIKTGGIYVEFEIVETAKSAKAEAVFWVGDKPGGTNVELTCGDTITVNDLKLKKTSSNPARYTGSIAVEDEYVFVFEREDEDPYISTIANMPAPITLLAPKGGEYARDESFGVTWEDNGTASNLNLLIESDCFWDFPDTLGKSVPDGGAYTVAADAFDLKSNQEAESCTATIELTRESKGSLSTDLKGTIKGKTRATGSFTSTPSAAALEE